MRPALTRLLAALPPNERAYWERRLYETPEGHIFLRAGRAGKERGALQSRGYPVVGKPGAGRGANELAQLQLVRLLAGGQLHLPFMQFCHRLFCGRRDCLNVLDHGRMDTISVNNQEAAIVRMANRARRAAEAA